MFNEDFTAKKSITGKELIEGASDDLSGRIIGVLEEKLKELEEKKEKTSHHAKKVAQKGQIKAKLRLFSATKSSKRQASKSPEKASQGKKAKAQDLEEVTNEEEVAFAKDLKNSASLMFGDIDDFKYKYKLLNEEKYFRGDLDEEDIKDPVYLACLAQKKLRYGFLMRPRLYSHTSL